jgi:epoxyqueuosine reductase
MTPVMDGLMQAIRDAATSLGFDAMGVAPAKALEQDGIALDRWLQRGFHGGMRYMARDPHRRSRPESVLPGARSAVVLAMNYFPSGEPDAAIPQGPGRVSRYARGLDYHRVIEEKLVRLEQLMRERGGPEARCRSYVDHGPVLEKAIAREAGIGFIGKNTLLITPAHGSWVFLSVILTTLELPAGESQTSQCGSCRSCLDACPTGALVEPFVLDARRCISYLTIESRGEIPEVMEEGIGGWIFGCDVCQEVCPFNARPVVTSKPEFLPDSGAGPYLNPADVLGLATDEEFKGRFENTPLLRARRSGMRRNAEVVIRNSRRETMRETPK